MLQSKFEGLQYKYWLRKRGCLDMVEYCAELEGITEEKVRARAGIDPAECDDKAVPELLGVPDDEKRGLYDSECDESE